ncbi:MAG TPA: glycosyltransferase [Thermoplasmata archaeon]|nr:glycosyltransferase [Thermoplasmata archaeon]
MPSLAIVNASDRTDGITQSVEPFADALAHRGFAVRWYQCLDHGAEPRVPPGGVRVAGLGVPWRTLDMGVNRLWTFPRALADLRADYVLLADPTLTRIAPAGARVAVYVHDLRPLSPFSDRYATRLMYRHAVARLHGAWRLLVSTRVVAEQLARLGLDPERVRVVPETHGLGLHPEHPGRSAARIAEEEEIRVLYVGTDRPYKNLGLVLELAARLARATRPRFSFTLLSRLRPASLRRIAAQRLTGVRVISEVESVGAVYDAHDVVVFPSRYEGFGRPLIEAMAYGLPILASRISTTEEVAGDAAILLDPDRPDEWQRALLALGEPASLATAAQRSLARGPAYLPEPFDRAVERAFAETPVPADGPGSAAPFR